MLAVSFLHIAIVHKPVFIPFSNKRYSDAHHVYTPEEVGHAHVHVAFLKKYFT